MGKIRVCTAVVLGLSILSPNISKAEGLLSGMPSINFDFVTPDENDIRDPYTSGEIEALYSDVPVAPERKSNCYGPAPLSEIIGGCNRSQMICVCNNGCAWLQVCRDE